MRPVTMEEIESLAIGAWILGTGGGGSPYLALLNMRELYEKGVVCRLMDASELADDDLVAVCSNMGAPLVGQERLTQYYFPLIVGNPLETALAISKLIFGGVLERLPDLRIAFAHGGGAFPFTLARLNHGWHVRPEGPAALADSS